LYSDDHDALLSGPQIQVEVDSAVSKTGASTKKASAPASLFRPSCCLPQKNLRHYNQFAGPTGEVRPGHTDLVKYHKSKGFVDIRGGGRSSYRSTISDVIGGSIARIFLAEKFNTVILSSICQVGALKASRLLSTHFEQIIQDSQNLLVPAGEIRRVEQIMSEAEIYSLDADFARDAADLIKQTRIAGDSIGAAVEVVAVNVPALVGEPLYHSLKLRLMGAMGGLHAAQYCEIGAGAGIVSRRGSENNDQIRHGGYQTNNQGGMIGGVTTGLPLVCRVGFKPTSTIVKPQLSVRKNLKNIDFQLKKGRHDPCVGVRAGITLESRLAVELMNAVLMHQSQRVDAENFKLF